MAKLTKQDAINFPANFLYVWASESFLQQIDSRSAKIIRGKQANQKKLLYILADDKAGEFTKYNALLKQVGDSFANQYGMSPKQALVTLAEGGEVADKNWKEGVYGIGATGRSNFANNTNITVDPESGVIMLNGVAQSCTPVYGKNGQVTNQNAIIDGTTYSSFYDKSTKRFYAYEYCPGDGSGTRYDAGGEKILVGHMTNSMWQDILSITSTFGDWILQFLQGIMTLFAGVQVTSTSPTAAPIAAENTTPRQSDGFIYNKKGTDLGILAIGTAAVALLFARRRKKD